MAKKEEKKRKKVKKGSLRCDISQQITKPVPSPTQHGLARWRY